MSRDGKRKMQRGSDILQVHFIIELPADDGCELFQTLFPFQDLIKDLHSELSGDFRNLVMAMLKSPAELDASELHNAMKASASIQTYSSLQITVIHWLHMWINLPRMQEAVLHVGKMLDFFIFYFPPRELELTKRVW